MKKLNQLQMEIVAAGGALTCGDLRDGFYIALFSFNYGSAAQIGGLYLAMMCPLSV